jgi:F-type H+-transporting ATPase subunit epsilon
MQLRLLLPSEVFLDNITVLRIVAETSSGSFGILPHRLDCVAALVPGILTYEEKENIPVYLAVDEGVLVKVGPQVLVSVRRAIGGSDLGQLHEAVNKQFLALEKQERDVRDAIAKMESSFIGRIAEFVHDQ